MLVSKRWLERQRAAIAGEESFESLTLAETFAKCSPRFVYPHHLQPVIDAFEDCEASFRERRLVGARYIVSTAPQHAKSATAAHAVARMIARNSERRNAFVANSMRLARRNSRTVRGFARELGVALADDAQAAEAWETSAGGALLATGIGGHLTGEPIDGILVIDDPVKNWEQASSIAYKDKVMDWFESVADSRLHPGAAVVIIATRWAEDDLSGRLLDQGGWTQINLPAIGDDGKALWEDMRPLEWLEAKREKLTEKVWHALYQGNPRPPGGIVFGPATTCALDDIPMAGPQSIGVDLAYSVKKTADETAVVVLRRGEGRIYVVDAWTGRVAPTEGVARINGYLGTYPGPARWYSSAQETAQSDALRGIGLGRVASVTTRVPKDIRAIECAAAWQRGDIVVPLDAPWSAKFIAQVTGFTGLDGGRDDLVDALVAAFDCLPEHDTGRVSVPRAKRTLFV